MDADIQAWVDQYAAQLQETIRRHGWSVQYIGGEECSRPGCTCPPGDGPPFAYTIGLFGLGHPELLIFGLDPDTALRVLNELGQRIRAGEALLPHQVIEFEGWKHQIVPEEVPNPGEIVFGANDFYDRPDEASVPVLQLSYNDSAGRFPWDEGGPGAAVQPRPGTFRA